MQSKRSTRMIKPWLSFRVKLSFKNGTTIMYLQVKFKPYSFENDINKFTTAASIRAFCVLRVFIHTCTQKSVPTTVKCRNIHVFDYTCFWNLRTLVFPFIKSSSIRVCPFVKSTFTCVLKVPVYLGLKNMFFFNNYNITV